MTDFRWGVQEKKKFDQFLVSRASYIPIFLPDADLHGKNVLPTSSSTPNTDQNQIECNFNKGVIVAI